MEHVPSAWPLSPTTTDSIHPAALAGAQAGVAAHRVIFVDLARALAVFLMIEGHTTSALLRPGTVDGWLYAAWNFQRGLTSCVFLLLSGFAFSIATSRHWDANATVSWRMARRVRRFLMFAVLGYALHFPVARLDDLARLGPEGWRVYTSEFQQIWLTMALADGLLKFIIMPLVFYFLNADGAASTETAFEVLQASEPLPVRVAADVTRFRL